MALNIYLASSWRNQKQRETVLLLRAAGYSVYDFRQPAPDNTGFSWREIDPNWIAWTPEQFREGLKHPLADKGYGFDIAALDACDVCVMLQPCGRSSAAELGYAKGRGKRTAILLAFGEEPELMTGKMADRLFVNVDELLVWLRALTSAAAA